MKKHHIEKSVYQHIRESLFMPEEGGILGADNYGNVIAFYHDVTGFKTDKYYYPDVERLNGVINYWGGQGIKFIGFVHTHRKNKSKLSFIDLKYALKIKKSCKMQEILMILYFPECDVFKEYLI